MPFILQKYRHIGTEYFGKRETTLLMARKKVKAIRKCPTSLTTKDVRSLLGAVSYYRKFIDNFSDLARPLTDLTKKENTANKQL